MADDTIVPTAPIAEIPLAPRLGWRWWLGVLLSLGAVGVLAGALVWLVWAGVGVWGNNVPFVWGFDITNYVWFIGLANGTSLFASILVLRRHSLRTSINRFAEGAALFAVICAAIYPIIHLGRPWLFYWMLPYPPTFQVWPQFRSPLTWDFWAISAHVIMTSMLWYVGLIPDLATLRDRAQRRQARIAYGILALGWRGSATQWAYHQRAYRIVAILVLPLILVMQSAVAFELASTMVPDWHEMRMPLHFVVTGLASGLAIVMLCAVILRGTLALHRYIPADDIDLMARLLLASVLVAAYVYAGEISMALLSEETTRSAKIHRFTGDYAWAYLGAIGLIGGLPQVLWWRRLRLNPFTGVVVSIGVAAGVWLDRLSIVVGGIQRDHLPSTWGRAYVPSANEWLLLIGTIGLFVLLFHLFVRFLPVISMFETRHEEG
jgi:Ni/Fe-hydrogenase subunit HybB-like protein